MITTLLAIAATSVSPMEHIVTARLLNAIQQVEGHKWSDPGGALAIQPATWRQHSHLPYRFASLRPHAEQVARRHLEWLAKSLRDDGWPVTPYALAACWRFGFEGYKRRNAHIDYAIRVQNLYFEP